MCTKFEIIDLSIFSRTSIFLGNVMSYKRHLAFNLSDFEHFEQSIKKTCPLSYTNQNNCLMFWVLKKM